MAENKNVETQNFASLHFTALIRCRWILFHHDLTHDGGAVRFDFQEINPFGKSGDVDNLFAALKVLPQHLLPDGVEHPQALQRALLVAQPYLAAGGVGEN